MANGRFWAKDEDELIRRMWSGHTVVQISHRLINRSAESVSKRGRKLGLPSKARVPVKFTEEQIQEIISLRDTHKYEEIAAKFGVSVYPIYKILHPLRLPRKHSGPAKGTVPSRPPPPVKAGLQPLEIAPGNFAVDARSYELITGRRI